MGVCMSKAQSFAQTIDKKEVEMMVKSRQVELANRAATQQAEYTRRIDAGETVVVNPAELLPKTDLTGIDTTLTAQTTPAQRLKTALYVSTNTIYRNQLKTDLWTDLKAGMEKRKIPQQIVDHSQMAANPMIDMALDKQIGMMASNAEAGKPLVSEDEIKEVQDWQAAHPKAGVAASAPPAPEAVLPVPAPAPAPVALDDKTALGGSDGGLIEKEAASGDARDGLPANVDYSHEQNTAISAI